MAIKFTEIILIFLLAWKLFIDCVVLDNKYPQKKSWRQKEVCGTTGVIKKMTGGLSFRGMRVRMSLAWPSTRLLSQSHNTQLSLQQATLEANPAHRGTLKPMVPLNDLGRDDKIPWGQWITIGYARGSQIFWTYFEWTLTKLWGFLFFLHFTLWLYFLQSPSISLISYTASDYLEIMRGEVERTGDLVPVNWILLLVLLILPLGVLIKLFGISVLICHR